MSTLTEFDDLGPEFDDESELDRMVDEYLDLVYAGEA